MLRTPISCGAFGTHLPFPIFVWGVLRGGARSAENHLQACPLMILLHWMPILDPPPGCPCLRGGGGMLSELGYQAQVFWALHCELGSSSFFSILSSVGIYILGLTIGGVVVDPQCAIILMTTETLQH